MKYTELLSIPIRVLGFYILYSAFIAATGHYFALIQATSTNPDAYKTYSITATAEVSMMLVTAFLLTKLPLKIAKLISTTQTENTLSTNIKCEQLQSVALSILGIYILTSATPDLIFNAAWIIIHSSQPATFPDALSNLIINELATIIEVLAGLFLCIRSDGIGFLINRIKMLGSTPSN